MIEIKQLTLISWDKRFMYSFTDRSKQTLRHNIIHFFALYVLSIIARFIFETTF